jgi:nitrite reductase (NADH) small subunit
MPRVSAGPVDRFPLDRPFLIEIAGRRIALVRRAGGVHALDDACPHAGGPLSEGTVAAGALTCPYHAWVWDLATGDCRAPARDARVTVYPAGIEAGEVWIDLP